MVDVDTFLTTLYAMVDDFCHSRPPKRRPGPKASLSSSEVLTLAGFARWSRFDSERDFYRYADAELRDAFPTLPGWSNSIGWYEGFSLLTAVDPTGVIEHLSRMMSLAVALGIASAVVGYYLAALLNVAIAGMMAVVAGMLFILALLLSPSHGLAASLLQRRRNRRSFARELLLSRLGALGGRAAEQDLSNHLDWDGHRISQALQEALRRGFVLRSATGEVALTRKGRETATGSAGSTAR